MAPKTAEAFPAGHGVHASEEAAPLNKLNVPAGQIVQTEAPTLEYEPLMQFMIAVLPVAIG